MRRSVPLLLTSVLARATGIALLAASQLMTTPASEAANGRVLDGEMAAANTALVRRFYDAVNHTLRTGDANPLDGLVAPDFIEHGTLPGLPANRVGLVRYLVGLHTAFPAMRLTVVDLLAQDDEVMARLRVDGVERGEFVGLPVPGDLATWGPLDVFRVEHGAIVEHWPSRDGAAWLRPLAPAPLALPSSAGASLQAERLTYAPGASVAARRNIQLRVLSLEAGALDVWIDGDALLDRASSVEFATAGGVEPVAGEVRLRPGDALVLPFAAGYRVRNQGRVPAVSLEVAVVLPRPLTPMTERIGPTDRSGGITADLLASTLVPESVEAVTVGIGRVILGPGGSIPAHATTGLELFHVQSGIVDPATGNGTAWTSRGTIEARGEAGARGLRPGEGTMLGPDGVAALRNPGEEPATLLVVTLGPAGEPGTEP